MIKENAGIGSVPTKGGTFPNRMKQAKERGVTAIDLRTEMRAPLKEEDATLIERFNKQGSVPKHDVSRKAII